MNDFTENYELNKKDFSKICKKDALFFVQEMIERMKNEDHDPFFYGHALAKLETYFSPPLSPKKDPLDWAIQALHPKEKGRMREYVKVGVVIPELGLCCTDSKRLHILLDYKSEKPIVDCNKNWWTCEEIGEDADFNWYPDVKHLIEGYAFLTECEPEVYDIDYIDVGPHRIKRKYFNQAIAGMETPVWCTDEKRPVFVKDGNRLAAIMPVKK